MNSIGKKKNPHLCLCHSEAFTVTHTHTHTHTHTNGLWKVRYWGKTQRLISRRLIEAANDWLEWNVKLVTVLTRRCISLCLFVWRLKHPMGEKERQVGTIVAKSKLMSHVEALFMSDWHLWVKQWLAEKNNAGEKVFHRHLDSDCAVCVCGLIDRSTSHCELRVIYSPVWPRQDGRI